MYLGDLYSLADGGEGGEPVAIWTSLSNSFNGYFAQPTTSISTAVVDGLKVTTVVSTKKYLQVGKQKK